MNRRTYESAVLMHGIVELHGSFAPAGTGVPTAAKGTGYTVARTGVGTFTLTLADKYLDVVSVAASAQCNAANSFQVEVGAVDLAARTVVLRTLVAGAAADVAANANNRVNFRLALKNSSVKP